MHQFSCFFLKTGLKFHIDFISFLLEHPQMKSGVRKVCMTVHTSVRMNTGRVIDISWHIKTRNNPCLIVKIMVFQGI